MTQVETEPRAPESKQPSVSENADSPTDQEQAIARINVLLPQCSPAFLRGLGDEISERQNEATGDADPPVPADSDNPQSLDALKRLSELYPKEVDRILHNGVDWQADINGRMFTKMLHNGWVCFADTAEFVENWEPGNNVQQTKSGSREQLVAIVRASNAFDKLACLHTAASKLLEEHATGSGGKPTMSERDCTTLDYLLNSADDIIEEVNGKNARHVVEFGKLGESDEDAEPNIPEQPAEDTPAAALNLDDIREQVRRIIGLVDAANISERCFSDVGPDAFHSVDPEDYFNAVSSSIATAVDELTKLQKMLATPEPPAKGGAE